MKQLIFMLAMTAAGTLGVYVITPFLGVFVYYLFAVLRPQFMWQWSLPVDVAWSFYVALATISAALLGMHGGLSMERRQGNVEVAPHRLTTAHRAVLIFAVWIGLSYLMAQSRAAAEPWFEEYLKIFIMYFVSFFIIRTAGQVWCLFLMVGLVLGYIAYEINYLYLVNNYLGIYHNGYGGLDNNGAGLMLAMGVPICWFAFEGMQSRWRWGLVALIPVIMHAVLMTYSRGAMLSLLVVSPVLLLRSRLKKHLSVAFLGLGLVAIPMMAGPEIQARFLTIQDHEIDDSAQARQRAWAAAWAMALDYPILGVGVRNANLFSYRYGADEEGRTIHSQYLQIAADNGIVGMGLYLFMFAATCIGINRLRGSVKERTDLIGRRMMAVTGGVECSLVLYSFGSIFLSLEVFELPYLLLLLGAQSPVTMMNYPKDLAQGELEQDAELARQQADSVHDHVMA